MSRAEQSLDPRTEPHDFALLGNGAVYRWKLDDEAMDAVATEAVALSTAAILAELWQPDAWEMEAASFADGYRHDELSVTMDHIPVALDPMAVDPEFGLGRVGAAQDAVRVAQSDEPPWAIARLAGRGRGWIRVALPEGVTPPERLSVWNGDGWYPIEGRIQSAPDVGENAHALVPAGGARYVLPDDLRCRLPGTSSPRADPERQPPGRQPRSAARIRVDRLRHLSRSLAARSANHDQDGPGAPATVRLDRDSLVSSRP